MSHDIRRSLLKAERVASGYAHPSTLDRNDIAALVEHIAQLDTELKCERDVNGAQWDWANKEFVVEDYKGPETGLRGKAWVILADFPNQTLREAIDADAETHREMQEGIKGLCQ